MPWDPEKYNTFKEIRFRPFFDLAGMISDKNLKTAVDIGCGTGEQTKILSQKFENATFLGIDSSAEMLDGSDKLQGNNLLFEHKATESFANDDSNWDLIFSNAALQWSDNHSELFPRLITKLNPGGQLAVQMPCQPENTLNVLLNKLVSESPFCESLNGFVRHSPVLKLDDYAKILFDNEMENLNISVKVYPIIAKNEKTLFDFISGSALIPYMERLDQEMQQLLQTEYPERIRMHFGTFPAIYPFKRILIYGIRK